MGRKDESLLLIRQLRGVVSVPAFQSWSEYLIAWLERRPADMKHHRLTLAGLKIMEDPEAIFQEAWLFCDVGEFDHGLERIERAVAKGYSMAPTLEKARQFDPIRQRPEFQRVLAEARAGRDQALAVFREAGGERLVGRGLVAR